MIYRLSEKKDYRDLAYIHSQAFQGFFLTSLGIGFLQTYYKSVLNNEQSIAVCAEDQDGKILGFASGSLKAANYHRNLFAKNWVAFLFAALKSALSNPSILFRLAKNLDKNPNKNDDRNYSELLSIAILPQLKGSGTGKALLEHFEAEVLKRGGKKVALTTDYNNNERVINFYKKCGYEIFYDFITYPNRHMYKMIKTLREVEGVEDV